MEKEVTKIASITMTMEQLNIITGETYFPIGIDKVLGAIKEALDEKKPIFVEDNKTGKRYRLMEDSTLVEIK